MALLTVRASGAPPSLLYPEPGQVRDSILLSHSDGLPAVHQVQRAHARRPVNRFRREVQRVAGVRSSLIVTDCRTALASSAYDASGHAMLVGHVRHGWLVEVAAGRRLIRLVFDHPADGHMALIVQLEDVDQVPAVAQDIAARATTHSADRLRLVNAAARQWRVLAAPRPGS